MSDGRWFRFYEGVPHHPKVLRLSDRLYRLWTYLLCFAAANGGALPASEDIALSLRVNLIKLVGDIEALILAGLLDRTEAGTKPHNWSGRQFKSDVSTERVKQFRKRKRNVSSDVSETPPESETEPPYSPPKAGDSVIDREFEEFYSLYPTHVGRGQAIKAYRAARKKVSREILLEAAQRWAVICEGKEARFIANPATWLNGERWADEEVRIKPMEYGSEEWRRFVSRP